MWLCLRCVISSVCVLHTEFLHDLFVGHLASLLLLPVSRLRGGVSFWSWERVYHRPRVHLTQHRKETFQEYGPWVIYPLLFLAACNYWQLDIQLTLK